MTKPKTVEARANLQQATDTNPRAAGRPGKDGAIRTFKLSDEVIGILDEASAGKGKGEKTRIVEEAVREWAEKRGITDP